MRAKLGLTLALVAAGTLIGRDPVEAVNKDRSSVAIKGYDPVAYFKEGKPVKGTPAITEEWMGAKWQFSSSESRDLFRTNPGQYAPQYGGYCAWAVSHGYTADTDPEAWKIVDGKLYLNYNKGVQKKWSQDIPKHIQDGNRNWPALHK
jgi:hypothetical protein